MEALSGYQADCSLDREKAFLRWELPARFLGYRLLLLGLRNGWPILFEHSNALREHVDLYKKIKSLGSEESFFPGGASKKTLGLLDRFVT